MQGDNKGATGMQGVQGDKNALMGLQQFVSHAVVDNTNEMMSSYCLIIRSYQ